MDIDASLDNLFFSLQPSNLFKIILFGSYANGNFNERSDLMYSKAELEKKTF